MGRESFDLSRSLDSSQQLADFYSESDRNGIKVDLPRRNPNELPNPYFSRDDRCPANHSGNS